MFVENQTAFSGLARDDVLRFWEQTNPKLLALLQEMEQRETWVLGDSEATLIVQGLESIIPQFCQQHFAESLEGSDKAALLATLVGYMGASQFVAFLLQAEKVRDGVLKNITYAMRNEAGADANVYVDLFIERVQLVLQTDLKSTVFSGKRIKELGAIIKQVNQLRAEHAY